MDDQIANRIEAYKNKGIKNFDSDVANKIYEFLFKNWHTKIEVSSHINPEAHKYNKRQKRVKPSGGFYIKDYKVSALGYIRDYVNAFYELGWLEIDRKLDKEFVRKSKGVKFRANLEPYFEYIKVKRGIILSKELKAYLSKELEKYRNAANCYKNLNYIESLDKFIKEIIIYPYLKGYLDKLTNFYYDKESKNKVILQLNLAIALYDSFTLKLLQEYLVNKISLSKNKLTVEEKSSIDNLIFKIERKINPEGLNLMYEISGYSYKDMEKMQIKEREKAEDYNKELKELLDKSLKKMYPRKKDRMELNKSRVSLRMREKLNKK